MIARLICFLFVHRPADIGCARIKTGKRVLQCMCCGKLFDTGQE